MGLDEAAQAERKEQVAGQFAVKYKTETTCWTQKLNKEDYGRDKFLILLADKVAVERQKTLLRILVLLVK